jgi:hypothetical protein
VPKTPQFVKNPWEKSHVGKVTCQDGGCLSERALLTSISKVFLENVVQLWLQAKPEAVETFRGVFDPGLTPSGKGRIGKRHNGG